MKIGIIQFPGSNCERETMLAVKRAGMEPVEFLWNESKEKLSEFDGYIIVGGFSYEDRSRSGIIAALDPIMQIIKQESEKGKPVLGICNGAQILVECGLVPGIENNKIGMALTVNKRLHNGNVLGTGFYNAWVNMRLADNYQLNAFTKFLTTKDILSIPIAHGEGRFVIPSALLEEMKRQGQTLFQYCDNDGKVVNEFPVNPNGSDFNLAAVSNKAGNVMAMMPHPERTTNGDKIFQSMRDYIAKGNKQSVTPLMYYPRFPEIKKYEKKANEWIVSLMITDNQAMSVENALQHVGIPVKCKRYTHWEIVCDSLNVIERIKASGVLFNDRKEKLKNPHDIQKQNQVTYLVRAKEDMVGLQKFQMLKHHHNIEGLHAIYYGVLWQFDANQNQAKRIVDSAILFNHYAEDCYDY